VPSLLLEIICKNNETKIYLLSLIMIKDNDKYGGEKQGYVGTFYI
jgi:hypothetical protein